MKTLKNLLKFVVFAPLLIISFLELTWQNIMKKLE